MLLSSIRLHNSPTGVYVGGHGQFHDEGGSKDSPHAYVVVEEEEGGNDVKDDSKDCGRDLGGNS